MNDGGPAFPAGVEDESQHCSGNDEAARVRAVNARRRGMSLRDWFAGMAMQGMYAEDAESFTFETVAKAAYLTADAMLKERDKKS